MLFQKQIFKHQIFRLNCESLFFLNYTESDCNILESLKAGRNTCLTAALFKAFAKLFRVLEAGLQSRSWSESESEVLGRSQSRTVKSTRSQSWNILSDSNSLCTISLHISDINCTTYAAAQASGVQCSNFF